jgi:AraC-like DNA-binding protein
LRNETRVRDKKAQEEISSGRRALFLMLSPGDKTVLRATLAHIVPKVGQGFNAGPACSREFLAPFLHCHDSFFRPIRRQFVERLRRDFDRPLGIEGLAREMGMSPSGFHEHFKAVTALSPLQFQKRLRLQEARRLLLGEDLDAASAAYRVGYRDASHFNREYKSLFGAPPMRDVQRLREEVQGRADR